MVSSILRRHPALWMGLLLLASIGLSLGWGWILLPWIVGFFWPWLEKNQWLHCLLALIMGLGCYFYAKLSFPTKLETKTAGTGFFRIAEIRKEESPFGKHFVYMGRLLYFQDSFGNSQRNLPCRIYIPLSRKRPVANSDYILQGQLIPKQRHKYVFKPNKSWFPVEKSHSFSEWRYQAKNTARKFLAKTFSDSKVFSLFCALTLGEIDDRQLAQDFRNLGLSHILAISGFHFALIAATLTLGFRFILPKKIASIFVLFLLTSYAFFLGSSPSILRAWTAISLFLLGQVLGYRTSGLNALGVGLIAELLFDPSLILQPSFSLSFLATAAILSLYPLCDSLLRFLFIQRTLPSLELFSLLDKHLYLLHRTLHKALALNLSVHLVGIPACLWFFHVFPCLSMLYNIFYPFLISLSVIVFLITLPINAICPPLASFFHECNQYFTQHVLDILSHPPSVLRFQLHVETFPGWIFSFWLLFLVGSSLLFSLSLRYRQKGILQSINMYS